MDKERVDVHETVITIRLDEDEEAEKSRICGEEGGSDVKGNGTEGNEVKVKDLKGNGSGGNDVKVSDMKGNGPGGNEVKVNDLKGNWSGGNEVKVNDLKGNGPGGNDVNVKDLKKSNDFSIVIDVKCDGGDRKMGENLEGECQRVCRICHLSTYDAEKCSVDLIELGCGCKGELGFVHSRCSEAWFKLKGNRVCEICGEVAQSVTGVSNNRFIEEWNDARSTATGTDSTETTRGWWRGQPFCNFLMACLVISFMLPWFFRVNMF
ncbi:hypothetical protein T459_32548 [Capsicum annuum]|uniref:RING-CH-type domain-containing protein n=1 Tax=Capsicum annuum TaxID=4072 RepID=A0A2G2Y1I7_CAPAN|nr:hypothetical protein T459_32548 [Capsicum annuum]